MTWFLCAIGIFPNLAAASPEQATIYPAGWVQRVSRDQCAGLASPERQGVQRNDPDAMVRLAILEDRGCGVPQDMSAAFRLFKRAVASGSTDPLPLGYVGLYGTADDATGLAILGRAVEANTPFAASVLGFHYGRRFRESADHANALRFNKLAAAAGDVQASVRVALETIDVPGERAAAVARLKKAVAVGDPFAYAIEGSSYHDGSYGYPVDRKKGFALMFKGVALGSAQAKMRLTAYFLPSDFTDGFITVAKATQLAESGAAALLPRALFDGLLGEFYLMKEIHPADYRRAFQLIENAEALTAADYDQNLSYCYLYGVGVQKDVIKAIMYAKRAAKKGSPEAIAFLKTVHYTYSDTVDDTAESDEARKRGAAAYYEFQREQRAMQPVSRPVPMNYRDH